jgi:hypothetical protein
VRLSPPPPDICLYPNYEHSGLMRSLAVAMSALAPGHAVMAWAMSDLGAIDLPPGSPGPQDRGRLQAAAPLYFSSALEDAGLLSTAELIAGLFASGAITQPLGPTAALINDFWRNRRQRLDANERRAIFNRVIEVPYFDTLMARLCEAIVAQADGGDLRERVALEAAAGTFGEFLAQRVDPMAAIAARDIVDTINLALGFMRDRLLQTAFGVQSLWQLVAVAGQRQGQGAGMVQRHVDQGRAGQTVLLWLADNVTAQAPLLDPNDFELIGAAQRWLSGRIFASQTQSQAPVVSPALPAVA